MRLQTLISLPLLIIGCSLERPAPTPTVSVAAPQETTIPTSKTQEHCVIVTVRLSNDEFGSEKERLRLWSIADQMEEAVIRADAGEYDGDGFGGGVGEFFFYGPSADELFESIRPVLASHEVTRSAQIYMWYGDVDDPGARERTFLMSDAPTE